MKISIKAEDDFSEDCVVGLSNDDMDNSNFVTLELSQSGKQTEFIDISVEELYQAVKVFENIRLNNLPE